MVFYDDDDDMIPSLSTDDEEGNECSRALDKLAAVQKRCTDLQERCTDLQERCTDQQKDMEEVLTMIEAVLDMEVLLTVPTKVKLRAIVSNVREQNDHL
jgi:K+/H+ antiporter YhaU regulatory subunit KhtT